MFDADSEFSLQTTTASDPLRQRWLPYRDFGKRAFDVAFVVILSPLLFPVIALLALAGRLVSFFESRIITDLNFHSL